MGCTGDISHGPHVFQQVGNDYISHLLKHMRTMWNVTCTARAHLLLT